MLPTISSPTDQRRAIDAVAYSNGLSMNCSLFAVLTFWLSTICAVGQPSSDQSAHPFLEGSALQTGNTGKASVPVFSSIDGYVCLFLRAELIRPAKRKVGIFSVPKHGLMLKNPVIDLRHTKASPEDWQKILGLLQPLEAMHLDGPLQILLPNKKNSQFVSSSMPRVYKDEISSQSSHRDGLKS